MKTRLHIRLLSGKTFNFCKHKQIQKSTGLLQGWDKETDGRTNGQTIDHWIMKRNLRIDVDYVESSIRLGSFI